MASDIQHIVGTYPGGKWRKELHFWWLEIFVDPKEANQFQVYSYTLRILNIAQDIFVD